MKNLGGWIVVLLIAGGCGAAFWYEGNKTDSMDGKVKSYLGSSYQVMGCNDAHFSQGGSDLWKCQVASGQDAYATWDIAVRDGKVVDASPA